MDTSTNEDWDDIREPEPVAKKPLVTRRGLLALGSTLAVGGASGGLLAGKTRAPELSAKGLRKVKLAWNPVSLCLSPALAAQEFGIYEKHGLDVELVNYGGTSDLLLEAMSTGKAEFGVSMILRWIKPMEQGFDVKFIGGTHGGCSRIAGSRSLGIEPGDPKSLRGKVIGVSDIRGSARNTFTVLLKAHGLNPFTDVEWKSFPPAMLGEAVKRREVHAIAESDPVLYMLQKQSGGDLVEVMTNLSHPWEDRVCCVLAVRGDYLRENRETSKALALALQSAASICNENPEAVAKVFQPHAKAPLEDLIAVLKSQTHDEATVGQGLWDDVFLYTKELLDVGIMSPKTKPVEFTNRIVDVLA